MQQEKNGVYMTKWAENSWSLSFGDGENFAKLKWKKIGNIK